MENQTNRERSAAVDDWLLLPMTKDFFAVLAAETYQCREDAIVAAADGTGDPVRPASRCEALRWVFEEGVARLRSRLETKEQVQRNEMQPEDGYYKFKKGGAQ